MTVTCGIDFGASKSVIAIHNGSTVEVIASPNRELAVPSVVYLEAGKPPLVGRAAEIEGRDKPEFCFRHVKRFFALPYHDGEDNGWQSAKGPDGRIWLRGPERDHSPTEVAGWIIKELLDNARLRLRNDEIDGAVITHPANYDDDQKACLIEAAMNAGLKRERIHLLKEPEAAVVPYGLDQDKIRALLVFDMGASTSDFTVLHGGPTKGRFYFESKESGALPKGGIDADYLLVDDLLDAYYAKHSHDLGQDGTAVARIREAAEAGKIELSTVPKANINLPLIQYTPPRSIDETITRERFEELLSPLLAELTQCVDGVLAGAGLTKGNIAKWVLVGGMTNVPAIRNWIRDYAGQEPLADYDPDSVVAMGAAFHAAAIIDKRIKPYTLVRKVDRDFGFETSGDKFYKAIPRGQAIPTIAEIEIGAEIDGQESLSVHVLEGDTLSASGSRRLASADLIVPPAPAGVERAKLTFTIDENGMRSVRHQGGVIYEGGVNV